MHMLFSSTKKVSKVVIWQLKMSSGKDPDRVNSDPKEYLFVRMETERAKIPNMLRNDYLPIFIVNLLREKLTAPEENSALIGFNSDLGKKQGFHPFGKTSTEESMWTDDTLLEENVDFEGVFLLTQEKLNYVGKCLKFAKSAQECFLMYRHAVGRYFTEQFEYPSLELLYIMDSVYKLLPLENYMLWLKEPSQIIYLKKQFLAFVFSPVAFSEDNRERSNRILQRFLQCIILSHYCNPCSKPDLQALKEKCGDILNLITSKLICEETVNNLNHKMFLATLKEVDLSNRVRNLYITDQIGTIFRSGRKPFLSGLEVLRFQEKYADPTKLVNLEIFNLTISQMIALLHADNVIQIVSSTLEASDFNWEVFLVFVTVWVKEKHIEATSTLKELIKKHIRDGLVSKNENDVVKGFILARHCTLIASDSFSRYEQWFKNMFNSDTYSLAKEPETFKYFVEILTQWLPAEPSCFLQIHITYWPFLPKGCRDVWNVYMMTAKERISECQDVEAAMECEPNPNDPIQHAIGNAIKSFESNGKVPSSILQMAMFAKPHYFNVFLPALLRKPTNVSLSDSRLRLIELLKREGKIPDDMYAAYKSSLKAS